MMFLRVRSATQTNILVGIRRLRFLWQEKLFSFRLPFFVMKAHVNNSYIKKILKQHNINYEKYVFVGNYYYLFGKMILGDPGAVS